MSGYALDNDRCVKSYFRSRGARLPLIIPELIHAPARKIPVMTRISRPPWWLAVRRVKGT
jgi:hypothetical protein